MNLRNLINASAIISSALLSFTASAESNPPVNNTVFGQVNKFNYEGTLYPTTSDHTFGTDMTSTYGTMSIDDYYSKVFISSPGANTGAAYAAGAVFLFVEIGNNLEYATQILDPYAENFDRFGESISALGDEILVGLPGRSSQGQDSGIAQLFLYNGLLFLPIHFKDDNGAAGDQFGQVVKLSENYAFISAPFKNVSGTESGAVFIFKRQENNEWLMHQMLSPINAGAYDNFGSAIGLEGDNLVIAAKGQSNLPSESGSGAVYLFQLDNDTWVQKDKIKGYNLNQNATFGSELLLKNNTVVTGVKNHFDVDNDGIGKGSVFIYQINGNTLELKNIINEPTALEGDSFGSSFEFEGNNLMIGAETRNQTGSVFHYDFVNFTTELIEEITLTTPASDNARFGNTMNISSLGTLQIGAMSDSDDGINSGSAYHFIPLDASAEAETFTAVSDRMVIEMKRNGHTSVFAHLDVMQNDILPEHAFDIQLDCLSPQSLYNIEFTTVVYPSGKQVCQLLRSTPNQGPYKLKYTLKYTDLIHGQRQAHGLIHVREKTLSGTPIGM